MEKIVHKLINEFTEGVDTYTHNGSTWLIFTKSKQWVIELTESKTLWYNYNFFKEVFEYTSMDVVENQHYITKWVEDNIINKVSDIHFRDARDRKQQFEDTLENGVKETKYNQSHQEPKFKEVLKNGVKHTEIGWHQCNNVDNTIEKGVKEIYDYKGHRWEVKDVIQDGVRDISPMTQYTDWQVEEIIENGVKETNHVDVMGFFDNKMEDTLQNGVREINPIKNNVRETKQFEEHLIGTIDEVIKNGVKETKTPNNGGDILLTIEWMDENKTKSVPDMIDDIIENGVKEIRPSGCVDPKTRIFHYRIQEQVDDVVDNGVKVSGTFVGGKRQKENIESVIDYGTKNPTD